MPRRHASSVTAEVDSALGPVPSSYAQPETVVLRFRRHGRRLAFPVLVLIADAAAAGYWVGALPTGWMNALAAVGALVLGLLLGVGPILSWLTRRTTVTTRRVISHEGVFVRHRSEAPLGRVREVRSRRGPLQRLFGAGDIDLLVGPESLRLRDVPGVAVAVDALQELMERNFEHSTRALQRASALQTGPPGRPADGDPLASLW